MNPRLLSEFKSPFGKEVVHFVTSFFYKYPEGIVKNIRILLDFRFFSLSCEAESPKTQAHIFSSFLRRKTGINFISELSYTEQS